MIHAGRYNSRRRAQRQAEWCERLFLHAKRLQLDAGDQAVDVSVTLPVELQSVLDRMGKVDEMCVCSQQPNAAT